MNLREIYSNKFAISFEVFPEENTENLYNKMTRALKCFFDEINDFESPDS